MTKKTFQADTEKLMKKILQNIYTKDDVFIRELICNSIDAKRAESELHVSVEISKKEKKLFFKDNGTGMSLGDLEEYIGKIGSSSKGEKKEQIGQFGLGFYSSLIVADRVHIYTRQTGDVNFWRNRKDEMDYELGIVPSDEAERFPEGPFCWVELFVNKKGEKYLDKAVLLEAIDKYFSFHPQTIIFGDADEKYTQKVKKHVFKKGMMIEEKFWEGEDVEVVFSIPKTREIDVFEQNVDLWKKVELYNQGILVTPNLQEICKDYIVPDFLKFMHIRIFSSALKINISRQGFDENQIKSIIGHFTGEFLVFLLDLQDSDPVKYKQFYETYEEFLFLGCLYYPKYSSVLFSLLQFKVNGELEERTLQWFIEKRMPEILIVEDIHAYLLKDLPEGKKCIIADPKQYAFLQNISSYKGAKILRLEDHIKTSVLQPLTDQEEKAIKAIMHFVNEQEKINPVIIDVYLKRLDSKHPIQVILDEQVSDKQEFQSVVLVINKEHDFYKRLISEGFEELSSLFENYYFTALLFKNYPILNKEKKEQFFERVFALQTSKP